MAATQLFTCVCGVQKKTSNHWILAVRSPEGLRFAPWDWTLALSDNVIVLCGERCAAGLLSRCLGDWKQAEFTVPSQSGPVRPVSAPATRPSATAAS